MERSKDRHLVITDKKEAPDRGIRVLEIIGEDQLLPTLIRLGYAAPQINAKKFNGKDERTIWRRWRAKMPQRIHDEEVRKRLLGYGDGSKINQVEVESRSRKEKHSPSNINTSNNYNGMYNSFMTQQAPLAQFTNTQMKKSKGKKNLCRKITSNCVYSFKEYCDHSSLHGLRYIGDHSINYLHRCFWIISVIVALMGTGYFIWHLYAKYSTNPIIISRSSESVNIDEFPFPAVTVCNMNNAKASVARQIVNGNDSLHKFYLDDVCDFKNESSIYKQNEVSKDAGNWENIYQFLLNVSQSCSSMLYHCQWHGEDTNCTAIFNSVLTDEGLCCRFNSVPDILYDPRVWENLDAPATMKSIPWNPEYKFKKEDSVKAIPWRVYSSGSNYGLTLVLDVSADEYFCSSTASVGFKLLLHSPVEMPQIKDFAFTLSPGKETRVIITPHIADADRSIEKIPVKIRRCYFLTEKKLRYYKIYTQRNCLLECEANFTLKFCQCMEYYMPVTNDTRICGKNDDPCTDAARNVMKNSSYDDTDRAAYNITEAPGCKCYPGCNEINYSTEISHSMLMTTFKVTNEFLKYNNQYFEKNIAVVHIFFIDTSYTKYSKSIIYGFAELLSNTGGLLGLFLGFSLLSVVEIFYFLAKLLWRIGEIIMKTNNNKNKFKNQGSFQKRDPVYPFAQ